MAQSPEAPSSAGDTTAIVVEEVTSVNGLEAEFEIVALPDTCPGCRVAWDDQNQCPRCSLSRNECIALLEEAIQVAASARKAASEGRFTEARAYIVRANELGLSESVSLRRLDVLCALITGDWSKVQIGDVPEAWREGFAMGAALLSDYESARTTAETAISPEDWQSVLALSRRTVQAAPWLLPAQKLHLLSLQGAGCEGEAESLRLALLEQIPAEPDLCRWRFSTHTAPLSTEMLSGETAPLETTEIAPPTVEEIEIETVPVEKIPLPTSPASNDGSRHPNRRILQVSTGTLLTLGVFALGYFKPWQGATNVAPPANVSKAPQPVAAIKPTRSKISAHTPKRMVANPLPVRLQRIREGNLQSADLAQARRWFNEAIQARRRKEYRTAYDLADGAYRLSPKDYLAEEALLLRAQSADNLNYRRAASLYEILADRLPRSRYAPLSLLLAAQVAQRQGRLTEARAHARKLQMRYPESKEALRVRHLLGSTRVNRSKNGSVANSATPAEALDR